MSVAWFWSLLLVGATVFLSVAGTLMVRRLIPVEVLERHNEVAGFHLCRHRRRLCPAAWLRRDYGVVRGEHDRGEAGAIADGSAHSGERCAGILSVAAHRERRSNQQSLTVNRP